MPAVILLLIIAFLIIPSTFAYGEKIVYTNSYPTWYSYDCTDSNPNSWTQIRPSERTAIADKYFSYYNGNCYAVMQTFNLDDLKNLANTTSINYFIDSKSLVLTNQTANDQYDIDCELYYFGNVDTTSNISLTPDSLITPFSCTGNAGTLIETTIPFTSAQNATLQTAIQAKNYTQSFMIFPDFTNSDRTSWNSNGYTYAVGNFDNALGITGDGFNCVTIEASNMCNIFNEPWEAIKKALGEDYIGQWFYVLIFLPFPFSVFLITRNGAYAGFISLPIMLVINSIDQVVFEISLSMILIASAFGFYELLRKKIHE